GFRAVLRVPRLSAPESERIPNRNVPGAGRVGGARVHVATVFNAHGADESLVTHAEPDGIQALLRRKISQRGGRAERVAKRHEGPVRRQRLLELQVAEDVGFCADEAACGITRRGLAALKAADAVVAA